MQRDGFSFSAGARSSVGQLFITSSASATLSYKASSHFLVRKDRVALLLKLNGSVSGRERRGNFASRSGKGGRRSLFDLKRLSSRPLGGKGHVSLSGQERSVTLWFGKEPDRVLVRKGSLLCEIAFWSGKRCWAGNGEAHRFLLWKAFFLALLFWSGKCSFVALSSSLHFNSTKGVISPLT